VTDVEQNLKNVRERIKNAALKAGRSPEDVRLVAVTKSFGVPVIEKAISLGVKSIGETRIQEAMKKFEEIGRRVEWHMIGHLQSNKAKKAAELFDFIHSIDRLKIARKVSEKCLQIDKVMPVLVQVNLSGKTYGVKPEETIEFVDEIRGFDGIRVEGLMTIAPLVEPEKTRPYFRKLRELALAAKLKHLSMGMSNDFEVAVEEGATMVRIGTAIFGRSREVIPWK
jgi:hypothetical protein